MKYPKYVQVSHDAPDAWWDPKSGMWFKKEAGQIELKDGIEDASNIMRYLRFNYLIDITSLVNPPVIISEKIQKFVEQTARQLLAKDDALEKAALAAQASGEAVEEVKESNGKEACPYCGKEFAPKGLPNHMKSCKQKPVEAVEEDIATVDTDIEEIDNQ